MVEWGGETPLLSFKMSSASNENAVGVLVFLRIKGSLASSYRLSQVKQSLNCYRFYTLLHYRKLDTRNFGVYIVCNVKKRCALC